MGMDIEAAFKELDEIEQREIGSNEAVQDLIKVTSSETAILKVGNQNITILAIVPRVMRRRLFAARQFMKDGTVEGLERFEIDVYKSLAQLCIDPPWNNPKTWQYIDEQTGAVLEIFNDALEIAMKTERDIQTFRQK